MLALLGFNREMYAQSVHSIRASLPDFSKSKIVLKGFTFQGDTILNVTNSNEKGEFELHYPSTYVGLALIVYGEKNIKKIVLNHEDIDFTNKGEFSKFHFVNSLENSLVNKGINLLESRDFKLIELSNLYSSYSYEPPRQKVLLNTIKEEEARIDDYISSFPPASYAKFYIKFRMFMLSMNVTANKIPNRVKAVESYFNQLDFNDERLARTSYYTNFISIYFRLLGTYEGPERIKHINKSIDILLFGLKGNSKLLESMSNYLSDVLDQNHFYSSKEYLYNTFLNRTRKP